MILAYIPGCWDLLHVGHLTILERARSLCDRLIVGVPSDQVVKEDKGRLPIVPLEDRIRMLQALRCVDAAVPYYRLEFMTHLRMIKPDLLVVGETWGAERRHVNAETWVIQYNKRLVRLPYTESISTTAIQDRINERSRMP